MARKVVVAAWSVLSILGVAQTSTAADGFFSPMVILSSNDAQALYNRITQPAKSENYRGLQIVTKRFASADSAVRIDCAQTFGAITVSCAVTLDATKSQTGVSKIKEGVVQNSIVFELNNKKDINTLLTYYVLTGPITTNETVKVRFSNGAETSLHRFALECPKDWVFDQVTSCQGYMILR